MVISNYVLLHDPNNAASRAFLVLYTGAGSVLDDPVACSREYPGVQGYPTVVYRDAQGTPHYLYSPTDMAAVESWRQGVDNPPDEPRPTVITKYAFLTRFTATELAAALTAAGGSVPLQVGQKLLDAAQVVDLTDTNIQTYMALLVQSGSLSQDRANAIMTP